jgi:hypothetical protein
MMERFENVSLYPRIRNELYEVLLKKCDLYLDINYEGEILSALGQQHEAALAEEAEAYRWSE